MCAATLLSWFTSFYLSLIGSYYVVANLWEKTRIKNRSLGVTQEIDFGILLSDQWMQKKIRMYQ